MKALCVIVVLATAHFVVSLGLFCVSFAAGLRCFDTGETPSDFERLSDIAVGVLWFPFLQVAKVANIRGGGPAEWLLFFANSLLWGVFLYTLVLGCRRLSHLRQHEHVA